MEGSITVLERREYVMCIATVLLWSGGIFTNIVRYPVVVPDLTERCPQPTAHSLQCEAKKRIHPYFSPQHDSSPISSMKDDRRRYKHSSSNIDLQTVTVPVFASAQFEQCLL